MTNLAMDTNTLLSSPQTGVLTVAAVPTAGQGLALDASGQIPAGLVPAATIATSLPATPSSGQQVILTDSTTSPTYSWLMLFDLTANVWRFLGGNELYAIVGAASSDATIQGTASLTYTDLGTVGPSITLPAPGTYSVRTEALIVPGAVVNSQAFYSFSIGASAAVDANSLRNQQEDNNTPRGGPHSVFTQHITVAGATTVLTGKYKSGDGNACNFGSRVIAATPVTLT